MNDAADWMGIWGIILIVALISIRQSFKTTTQHRLSDHDSRLVKAAALCAAGLLTVTAVFNIWVNPWDIYGTDFFQSRMVPSRRQKLGYYAQLNTTPELIVMGNSTAFAISPQYIQETIGYTSFNWSIDAGRPAENRALLEYLSRQYPVGFPKVILMQVSEKPSNHYYDMTPVQLLPYLPPREMLAQGTERLSKLFSISQWADSAYVVRNTIENPTNQWGGWLFTEDGYGYKFDDRFSKALTPEQINKFPNCNIPKKYRDENIEDILAFVDEQNSSIVFYISPLLPEFYNTYLQDAQNFQNCHQTIAAYFTELSQNHNNVFFKDYLVLEHMNGLDAPEGFYDERHLKPENGERLIDALADTLEQAYDVAETKRSVDPGDTE